MGSDMNPRRIDAGPAQDIEQAVFEAMRLGGWILPQTPEEVLQAEKGLSESPVTLPEGLTDPYAVLERPRRTIHLGGQTGARPDTSVEHNLAQAAREGGEIPPEVRERMRNDRRAAEGKADG